MHINSPAEAWAFFQAHVAVLVCMPVVAGFIGWVTKVIAIAMVFKPIEFKGIGPIGWQGQLPRRAAKFGSQGAEIILDNVLDARALVDRLNAGRIAAELDEIMVSAIEDLARDLLGSRWSTVPTPAKAAIMARARARAPFLVQNLLNAAKDNISELFQLDYLVTSTLLQDKALLNDLVREPMRPIMQFMKRFGLVFGATIGLLQMVLFAFTENHLVIPAFGLAIGLVSDWLALQMIFHPKVPRRYCGLFGWYGLAFAHRDQFVTDYGKLVAEQILTPRVLVEAMLNGPLADRLFAMIQHEVLAAIDAELGPAERLVPAAIGSARYDRMRGAVVSHAQSLLPAAFDRIEGYATEAMDVERTLRETLGALSNDDLEAMLRPVFKDDEWLVVAVGGGLGFVVGEVQVFLLTLLGGL